MSLFGERVKALREQQGLTQDDLAEYLGMTRVNISNYERGLVKNVPADVIQKLADVFHTNADYLLGRTDDPSPFGTKFDPQLSAKDERDIAKDLDRIMEGLNQGDGLMFYGEEVEFDAEAKELLKASLEQAMRLAKMAAKKKFTPKKHRS
ncbi:transcriptional regulator [Alicyclobacillus hesperidum subsp. aegles]|uniref:helix-turn-helix domain-containing protein n=1 Tax=Alicyclobacillus hesperidum TaxID=89784 RepID=UPI00222B8AF6|nr:helix-turn-helix transcriptional regulator [Alicyclobacillus hesperidum]GLG00128.1 transcriptional regulator [Alicyclobacillus hesperidum subsp. aegles]